MTLLSTARLVTLSLLATASACTSLDLSSTGIATQQVGAVGVTTDKSVYDVAEPMTVTFSGLSGAPSDWVAIAHPQDPASVYEAWAYTGGGDSGSVIVAGQPLAIGTYEVRAFNDWDGTASFAVQARSTVITVGQASATVFASSAAYGAHDPVVVSYSGLPGTATDWVALAVPGSAPSMFVAWTYTNGAPNGEVTFTGAPVGTYVARTFAEDGYEIAAEGSSFTIGLTGVTVATIQPRLAEGAPTVVNYAGLSDNPKDWIAVAVAGSPISDYLDYVYTGGQASGQVQLGALPIGSYEVRAFVDDRFVMVASSPFVVGGAATMATDHATYALGDVVTLAYANLPGNDLDWVAVAPQGSDPTDFVAWKWTYVHGQPDGSFAISGLFPGTYEARAYSNDTYEIVASSTFTIDSSVAISTDAATYTTADTVTVSYSGLAGFAKDWICVAPAGTDDTECPTWSYTGGTQAGTTMFSGLAAGSYEARVYFDDSWTVGARSTFDVTE